MKTVSEVLLTLRYEASPRYVVPRAVAWTRARARRQSYAQLDAAQVRTARRSDTVFIFGSGRSLLEITPVEWEAIGRHDVFSLREFPRQQWVRADFHMTAEVDFLDPYARRIRENPLYASTIFLVQEGWKAISGNNIVGRRLLPPHARVFRFRRIRQPEDMAISRSFEQGVVHGANSITDAVNIAFLLGWRHIVLAGVDLYNKEYFWLDAGTTRTYERPGIVADKPWPPAQAIIDLLAAWRRELELDGVRLEVFNPRSLLVPEVPVFDRSQLAVAS